MSHRELHSLPIAVRVYPQPESLAKHWHCPEAMLVFDTETKIDETQNLTFGSYRLVVSGRCVKEGIFYADDLPAKHRRVLEKYVMVHAAEKLHLLTRSEFVDDIFHKAYKGRWLLVAFNFPFDIARVAYNFKDARGRFAGGFSLDLWQYS